MELITVFTTASKVMGTANTLRGFFEDDKATFLSIIEEVESKAAAQHLEHMKLSNNPSPQATLAISNLEAAYQAQRY